MFLCVVADAGGVCVCVCLAGMGWDGSGPTAARRCLSLGPPEDGRIDKTRGARGFHMNGVFAPAEAAAAACHPPTAAL